MRHRLPRWFPPLLFLTLVGPLHSSPGQQSSVLANLEKREAEERYARLNSMIQNLTETQEVLLKRIDALQQRCTALERQLEESKEENARLSLQLVTRDELKKVVDMLKEVQAAREEDKQLVLKQLEKLARVAQATPPETKPATVSTSDAAYDYVYTVEKGNTLSDIIAVYNAEFQKRGLGSISRDEVVKANPGLNPNLIVPGQKIRIPVPAKDR